jgi:hypothetical protein
MLVDDEPDINAALTVVISILLPEVYISRQSEMSSRGFSGTFAITKYILVYLSHCKSV